MFIRNEERMKMFNVSNKITFDINFSLTHIEQICISIFATAIKLFLETVYWHIKKTLHQTIERG